MTCILGSIVWEQGAGGSNPSAPTNNFNIELNYAFRKRPWRNESAALLVARSRSTPIALVQESPRWPQASPNQLKGSGSRRCSHSVPECKELTRRTCRGRSRVMPRNVDDLHLLDRAAPKAPRKIIEGLAKISTAPLGCVTRCRYSPTHRAGRTNIASATLGQFSLDPSAPSFSAESGACVLPLLRGLARTLQPVLACASKQHDKAATDQRRLFIENEMKAFQ